MLDRIRISRRLALLLLSILAAGVLTASPSWSEVRGMVTRVQADQVVVNIGLNKGARPGALLYCYDSLGKPTATVKVVQVDDYSSVVEIVSLEPRSTLGVGNNVSDQAYTPTPAGAAQNPSPDTPQANQKPVDPVKNFEAELKARTQIYSFKGGKGGVIKINIGDILNIASTVGGITGTGQVTIMNPWLISNTAYEYYERYGYSAKQNQKARSTLEVVYWDEGLTNAYADYYIYKETYLDAAKKNEVRQSLLAQRGVQTSAVFQVRVRNRGPGTLQIAPFDWHFYLLDAEGNRVKAERYDEILDKAMNPGQEVQGYVYFPKRDPLGHSYVGNPVQVLVEDIFGERTTIKWNLTAPQ